MSPLMSTTSPMSSTWTRSKKAGLRIAADALGGSGLGYWRPIAQKYGLHIDLINGDPDPTFSFMCVDKDGKIRMDCSSASAMAGLIKLKDKYDIAFGNDPDFDRHGIVTPTAGLMNPNHYLAVAINYLFSHRTGWADNAAIGKTLVSSSMIDRVAADLGRPLSEVPVGFKWFVDGLVDGSYGFGGEESAGASFLRKNGTVWSTDKDGIILCLLAAEITAVTGRDPGQHYQDLVGKFGNPVYARIDAEATPRTKGRARQTFARADYCRHPCRGTDYRQTYQRPPATAPASVDLRSQPKTDGSPPAPRAPRIFIKSTPSRSRASRI